jgi:D-alanine transaminase
LSTPEICYLNGAFLPLREAKISVLDRGFLFGDGVYEVIPVYGGRALRLAEHLERLERSLVGVGMANPLTADAWAECLGTLIGKSGGGNLSLYLQITRGINAKRDHAPREAVPPTVFAMASPLPTGTPPAVAAVVLPDNRWLRCDLKTVSLLPNCLLRMQAMAVGAVEAILVREGHLTEGAASNVFVVVDGVIKTPPKGPHLLPGITRDLVVEILAGGPHPVREEAVTEAELLAAPEIWLSSSTRELLPVTTLNERPVGSGAPGPLWDYAYRRYRAYREALGG